MASFFLSYHHVVSVVYHHYQYELIEDEHGSTLMQVLELVQYDYLPTYVSMESLHLEF